MIAPVVKFLLTKQLFENALSNVCDVRDYMASRPFHLQSNGRCSYSAKYGPKSSCLEAILNQIYLLWCPSFRVILNEKANKIIGEDSFNQAHVFFHSNHFLPHTKPSTAANFHTANLNKHIPVYETLLQGSVIRAY